MVGCHLSLCNLSPVYSSSLVLTVASTCHLLLPPHCYSRVQWRRYWLPTWSPPSSVCLTLPRRVALLAVTPGTPRGTWASAAPSTCLHSCVFTVCVLTTWGSLPVPKWSYSLCVQVSTGSVLHLDWSFLFLRFLEKLPSILQAQPGLGVRLQEARVGPLLG